MKEIIIDYEILREGLGEKSRDDVYTLACEILEIEQRSKTSTSFNLSAWGQYHKINKLMWGGFTTID